MKKHFGIYSYFYLFLISVLSIFCIDKQNYLTEIFPIMCYLGFIIFLITNLTYSKKLRLIEDMCGDNWDIAIQEMKSMLKDLIKPDIVLYFEEQV